MQGDGVLQTRRSVFEALLQLVPSAEVSTSKRSVSFLGPYVAGSDFGNEVLGAAEYVSFYQALVPEIAPEAYADRFCTPSHGVPVPIDPSVPISAHAKVLWRAQFEHAAKRDPAGGLPVRLDRDILRSFLGFGLLSNGLFSTTVAPVGPYDSRLERLGADRDSLACSRDRQPREGRSLFRRPEGNRFRVGKTTWLLEPKLLQPDWRRSHESDRCGAEPALFRSGFLRIGVRAWSRGSATSPGLARPCSHG